SHHHHALDQQQFHHRHHFRRPGKPLLEQRRRQRRRQQLEHHQPELAERRQRRRPSRRLLPGRQRHLQRHQQPPLHRLDSRGRDRHPRLHHCQQQRLSLFYRRQRLHRRDDRYNEAGRRKPEPHQRQLLHRPAEYPKRPCQPLSGGRYPLRRQRQPR